MMSLLKLFKRDSAVASSRDGISKFDSNHSLSLIPGSDSEHGLQEKYGTRDRALRFYDKQVLNHLAPLMQGFIAKQEMMFIATADQRGECDCSVRFGQSGFVRVINPHCLVYPEYRGNGVFASQGNMTENPHIGMLFVDFLESTFGLHVNGRASVLEADVLSERLRELPADVIVEMQCEDNKKPERWILVEVTEAYIRCSKYTPRLRKSNKCVPAESDDVLAKDGDFFELEKLSLYDRLGGEAAVQSVVEVLYKKIVADSEIGHFYAKTDVATQLDRLSVFVAALFGHQRYPNTTYLWRQSVKLLFSGFNSRHYDHWIGHLHASLVELGIYQESVAEVMSTLEAMREKIMRQISNL